MDRTDFIMELMDIVAKYVGKESGKDLTKEDIDKWNKEIVKPSLLKMVGWNNEDTEELEEYKISKIESTGLFKTESESLSGLFQNKRKSLSGLFPNEILRRTK
jgi:hypothetical protein